MSLKIFGDKEYLCLTPWKRIVELITLELYNNHPVNFVVEQTDSTTKKKT